MSVSVDTVDSLSAYAQNLARDPPPETSEMASIISTLGLRPHEEGGYFVETDRDNTKIPNPFIQQPVAEATMVGRQDSTRDTSTTIFYLLSPNSPFGAFHRNKGRTIHTLHSGRGCYIVLHADEADIEVGSKVRIEIFLVGHDIANGEKLQWIVEGGKFKTSFLLPDRDSEESRKGLLISETVTPGFEFADHDFMTANTMNDIATADQIKHLSWLLRMT